ncbi:MAG: MBL fold metallo-hydrolase [Kiritimatiellae bacterium]|nr:MBL fold metallo-hydrolase [Kiritimatiellia bacterium]
MIVKILGSAAAEAVPALWCECATCRVARKNGGKDIRRRTSYLIDDDSMVDFGPDAFCQMIDFRIDLSRIKRILFTHSHSDHLNPVDMQWRQQGFSVVSSNIKIFGNNLVMEKIETLTKESFATMMIEPRRIRAGSKIVDDDIEIYPLEAAHCLKTKDEQALNYVIGRNSRYILIANDTGWWPEKSWRRIRNFKLNAAVIECTSGINPLYINGRKGHLGANASVEFRSKLRELGALTAETPVYVNHFSHNGKVLHKDLCKFFKPHGIHVAYDGLTITV